MAKSVFQAGREKKARRKAFVAEAKEEKKSSGTSGSVFKAGRAKAAKRKEFTDEAKKAGKKAGNRRMTKDTKAGGTLQRGRRAGQTAGSQASDKSKAQLYKEAMALKKKLGRKEAVSTYDKKQLQAYILKHS
tara:strand:+ start:925 stop:1320 length:396 start_codon:yes stop_codon:yes gene_type:complete